MTHKAKIYVSRYLYFMAIFGGLAWAAFFYRTHMPELTRGEDYLYEQQQDLSRQINSLQQQLKAVVPE